MNDILKELPQLVSVDGLAKTAGVHRETIRRWIRAGTLRAYRVGSVYRIEADEVRRILLGTPTTPAPR